MQQLDIFDDSREAMLVNDLADAVWRGDLGAARAARSALADEVAGHEQLAPADTLIAELATRTQAPFTDAAQALAGREQLDARLAPAAHALLGHERARGWRAARLREMGTRALALPWQPAQAPAHAAAFLLDAGDWAGCLSALTGIASWRRQPQPLAWAAEATWRRDGADAGWPLLAELAWLTPALAQALIDALRDPKLSRLADRFDLALDGEACDWLPAWLLVEQPLLAAVLDAAQPHRDAPPEQAFKAMQALLRLERQGRVQDIAAQRKRLRALNPALFAAYMHTR